VKLAVVYEVQAEFSVVLKQTVIILNHLKLLLSCLLLCALQWPSHS